MNSNKSSKLQKMSVVLAVGVSLFSCASYAIKTPEELSRAITTTVNSGDQTAFNKLMFNRDDTLKALEMFVKYAAKNKGSDVTRDISKLKDESRMIRTHKRMKASFQSFLKLGKSKGLYGNAKFVKVTGLRKKNYKGITLYRISFLMLSKQQHYIIRVKAFEGPRGLVLSSFYGATLSIKTKI